eukprot:1156295-Pelagomonas_calceolata.AAC.8
MVAKKYDLSTKCPPCIISSCNHRCSLSGGHTSEHAILRELRVQVDPLIPAFTRRREVFASRFAMVSPLWAIAFIIHLIFAVDIGLLGHDESGLVGRLELIGARCLAARCPALRCLQPALCNCYSPALLFVSRGSMCSCQDLCAHAAHPHYTHTCTHMHARTNAYTMHVLTQAGLGIACVLEAVLPDHPGLLVQASQLTGGLVEPATGMK